MNKPFIICIIDDDDVYQFTATRNIKKQNIAKKILVFSQGEEAIDFLVDNISNNENIPDIIFLDLNMPIMDGWQFLEEYVAIKPRIGKKITLYIVTSSGDPVDLRRARQISEVSDYLVKPITPEMFMAVVNEIDVIT